MQEGGTSRLELEEQREINCWQTAESRPTWERQGWPELRPARAAARRRRWRKVIILTSLGKLSRQHSHIVIKSHSHTVILHISPPVVSAVVFVILLHRADASNYNIALH